MIKKIKEIFEPYMIRPMIYQGVTKILVGLAVSMLWNRFVNTQGIFSMVERAFFVVGLFFFMLAWFQYLRLDGMTLHHLLEGKSNKKKAKRHTTKDIADFADEKIISFAELEDEERTVVRLLTNLICGLIYFIPALITAAF